MKTIIECRNITKIYNPGKRNELKVLNRINLRVKEGEFLSIIGPSGSGKSTLLHIIGCLDRPTSGKVFVNEKDVSKLSDDHLARIRREKIGFVFQQFNLIPTLTAVENVEIPMRINGKNKDFARKRAKDLLDSVGLGGRLNHLPNQLSGGELQRVAIARSLANNPMVVLADEPTGNLDTKTGHEILQLMKNLNKRGHTFVIVTHDQEIASYAKQKIKIVDGKIIEGE